MSTLAVMKARIADELARDDLTSQIAYTISDAIAAYEDERFWWQESRSITITTVQDQEFYDVNDTAAIANILKIDAIFIYYGDQAYQLTALSPAEIESNSVNGTYRGQPSWYSFFNSQIRLYPVPADARTVRILAAVKTAAPASDGETGNPWMTHAERLIRSRAKLELALHVLKDPELAQTMVQGVEEAFDQLKERTGQLTQIGEGRITPMAF